MTAETIQMRVFGRRVDLPNPEFQRNLLARHDLHHVLTGYGTDLRGEAEPARAARNRGTCERGARAGGRSPHKIRAWELGAGPGHWFVWANNVGALFLGVLAPIRTVRAFARGLSSRSLYRDGTPYDALLDLTIDEARARLRIRGRA
jgi:hypothetical protein